MDVSKLKETLKKVVFSYLEKNPGLSVRSLAQQSGCGRYFLSKIVDDEVPQSLDANKVLLLAKFLSGKNSLKEIASAFDGQIKEELTKIFQVDFGQNKSYSNKTSDLDLYDSNEYLVLVLCTLSCGTTKKVIANVLGEQGISILMAYLHAEIIVEKKSRFFLADGTDFYTSLKIFKHHLSTYARYYNPDHIGQERNYLHVETQGLNRQGLKLAQSYHRELHEKLVQLKRDPALRGEIPWFSVGMMDTFIENLEGEL